MNKLLEAALEYASLGWHVFPCVPGKKQPITEHGVYDATTNIEKIKKWWEKWPNANIAVACGKISGITVVDIDSDAEEWLKKLPPSLTQKTPNGGFHIIYNYEHSCTNSVGIYTGIDIRTDGGYVVVSPSYLTNSGNYFYVPSTSKYIDIGLQAFPKSLIFSKKEIKSVEQDNIDRPADVLERASKYLATVDPAIQGQCGHNKLLYAADRLINGFCLTDQEAYKLLVTEYNCRCIPPWNLEDQKDAQDFKRKITEARKLGCGKIKGFLLNDNSVVENISDEFFKQFTKSTENSIGNFSSKEKFKGFDKNTQYLVTPPGLLGEICQWINKTSLVEQPLLALGSTLTFLGAILGRKVKDSIGSRTNLYCMGVARSSAGKNTSVQRLRTLAAEAQCLDILGGESIGSDSALEGRVAQYPAILFLMDEVGHFFSFLKSGLSRHNAQTVSLLMKLYSSSGSVYLGKEYAEKGKQRVIIQPCCCLWGTASAITFANGLSPDQLQDGWLSRCLVFYSNERPDKDYNNVEKPPPKHIVEKVKQIYRWKPEWPNESEIMQYIMPTDDGSYQERPPYQIVIPEEPEAFNCFRDFDLYTVRQGETNPHLATLWLKGEENARRIALICACSENFESPVITSKIAKYACNLVNFLVQSFIDNVAPEIVSNELERKKRKIIQAIKNAGKNGISKAALTRASPWSMQKERTNILDDLFESGEVFYEIDGSQLKYWTAENYLEREV